MSTSPRSHASMSGVTPFLSCGGRTGEARGGRRGQASSSRPGARRGWLAGDPGAGARGRATGGAEGDGDAARGSRGRPTWNPGSAPSRSAASTASASPALAARSNRRELIAADGARGAKCDASIRAPSIRVASTGTRRLVRRVSVSTGGVHRSSPRARLGRASFFESVVRPTSRRFLGPDTWAFLTRPSRVVPLDDRQRLVFVASILRRTRAPAAPGERLGAVAPAQNARAHRRTRAPREAPNAGDRPPGIARERSRARERRSRGAGSGSGVAAGVSARTIVG